MGFDSWGSVSHGSADARGGGGAETPSGGGEVPAGCAGDCIGVFIGEYYRCIKGDTRCASPAGRSSARRSGVSITAAAFARPSLSIGDHPSTLHRAHSQVFSPSFGSPGEKRVKP